MKKFDLELIGFQLLGELKERINTLEESFNVGAFNISLLRLSNVFELLHEMKRIFMGLKIYQEIYDVSS